MSNIMDCKDTKFSEWQENKNKSGVEPQDFLDRLYKMRDQELSRLWQNSVVLGAFIIGAFTAFGQQCIPNEFKIGIAIIGIIMSIIWIIMAKASKAWFEVHEFGIMYLEHIMGIPYPLAMGNFAKLKRFDKDKLSNWLFSTKGGRFSPSKVNIILGLLLLVVWSLCLYYSIKDLLPIEWIIIIILVGIFLISWLLKRICSSSALTIDKHENNIISEKFTYIKNCISTDNLELFITSNKQQ